MQPKLGLPVVVHLRPDSPSPLVALNGGVLDIPGVVCRLWGGQSVGVHVFLQDGSTGHFNQGEMHYKGGPPPTDRDYVTLL